MELSAINLYGSAAESSILIGQFSSIVVLTVVPAVVQFTGLYQCARINYTLLLLTLYTRTMQDGLPNLKPYLDRIKFTESSGNFLFFQIGQIKILQLDTKKITTGGVSVVTK